MHRSRGGRSTWCSSRRCRVEGDDCDRVGPDPTRTQACRILCGRKLAGSYADASLPAPTRTQACRILRGRKLARRGGLRRKSRSTSAQGHQFGVHRMSASVRRSRFPAALQPSVALLRLDRTGGRSALPPGARLRLAFRPLGFASPSSARLRLAFRALGFASPYSARLRLAFQRSASPRLPALGFASPSERSASPRLPGARLCLVVPGYARDMRMLPCPRCARHVRIDAGACPFCGDALAVAVGPSKVGLLLVGAATLTTLGGCPRPAAKYGGPPLPQTQQSDAPAGAESEGTGRPSDASADAGDLQAESGTPSPQR